MEPTKAKITKFAQVTVNSHPLVSGHEDRAAGCSAHRAGQDLCGVPERGNSHYALDKKLKEMTTRHSKLMPMEEININSILRDNKIEMKQGKVEIH